MRFLAFEPQRGRAWSWRQFNFDTDPPQMAAFSKMIDAINPDLTNLKKRGGKIIHYHRLGRRAGQSADVGGLLRIGDEKDGRAAYQEFYRLYDSRHVSLRGRRRL